MLLALSYAPRLRGLIDDQTPRLLCHLHLLVSFNPEYPSLANARVRAYKSLTSQVPDGRDIRNVVEDVRDRFRELGGCISPFIYDWRFSRELFPLLSVDRAPCRYPHGLTRLRRAWCVNLAVVLSLAKFSELCLRSRPC